MKGIKSILILRFRRVGDAVLSSIVCSSLRKSFPDATIDYVLNAEIAPLFENHPDIDRVITFSKEDMAHWMAYLKKVRRIVHSGKYDLILDMRATVKTLWFSLFSLRTPYRIGWKKAYNPFIHNYRPDMDVSGDQTSRLLYLLHPLEKFFNVCYVRHFSLYAIPEEQSSFARKMENGGIDFSKPVIVCAVTARLAYKVWDMERMRQILERIIEKYDVQLVFNFAGKEEEDAAIQLHRALNNHPRIFTCIKAGNLKELAALISLSSFFFGNEGGPRHISQGLRIPSFAIYPPSVSKAIWLPNNEECYQGIEPADVSSEKAEDQHLSFSEKFNLLTVDAVWEKLDAMLGKYV